MNHPLLLLIAAVLLFLAGLTAGRFFFRPSSPSSAQTAVDAAATDWTCSMHPQVRQPRPGSCPLCGMDLIPLTAAPSDPGGRSLTLTPEARTLIQLQTTPVVRRFPDAEIRLFGKVAYDETRIRTISARFPGRIERLYVDYTGITVPEGEHLARIYSPELLTAQEELLTSLRFASGGASASAARGKLRLWGLSSARIAAIEESGAPSDEIDIDAPLSGVVIEKFVSEGDYVETGTSMFRIAGLERLWILLDAYDSDLPWLRFGQDVQFTVQGLPGQALTGRIAFIAPDLDPATRTVKVRVNAPNEAGLLKPGMFARAVVSAKLAAGGRVLAANLEGKWISPMHPEIVKDGPGQCDICGMDLVPVESLGYTFPEAEEAPIIVPASAVLWTGDRAIVYLEKDAPEGLIYEGREIMLGARAGDSYLVVEGLEEGDRVVTQGAFKLDSSLQIQAKPSMMDPGPGDTLPAPRLALSPEFQAALEAVLEQYTALQTSLARDDPGAGLRDGAALLAAWQSMAPEELPEPAAGHFPQVLAAAQAAASASTLTEQRSAFRDLSQALLAFLDTGAGALSGDLFLLHCPMAFDNAGADWLQNTEEVLNPYFGASMLRCGEVSRRLPAAPASKTQAPTDAEHQH